ncbi:nitrate reductase molybdenum cofactor assembly chaperone [Streptomyces sp. YIM 98790]|uniref:nitrate reductase molybdenum cofactor assembly chaperone n=1 Tax=Streptomyces sp. YIM 98790 TaxID=2689077 RepID=UPI00140C9C85|nr:nitrate reductase molybdenum cofactor assembly chaperone [Streptomyces sp. YIM 98790]
MTPLRIPARARVRPAGRRPDALTPREKAERALVLRLLSLLLQYPDRELTAARAELAAAAAGLPAGPAAGELAAFLGWFTATPAEDLERHYVETFDLKRKSSLYLTYYLHGDTRRRGLALLALAQSYRAAGWEPDPGELPDHLPMVLEYAAVAGPGAGEAPLRRHRRGIGLIRHSLTDLGSPYRHLLTALLTLLPPPSEDDLRAVAELAAAGPPAEDVGLEPYGAPGAAGPGGMPFAPPGAFAPPPQAPPAGVHPAAAVTPTDPESLP